ncbi:MAG: hypothetical protein KJ655_01800 [Candidatus Thermoplasmatota archaeon]|nr:hypothetical protein [Candidatus Thermoplasmatota archaeon]
MNDETETLRKFLDNLPSKPCKTRPEPRLCKICVRLNKNVASICPFSKIKLEKTSLFDEPTIEVIRAKEKILVLEPLSEQIPSVPTLEPLPTLPKMETRLTELKRLRRKKISICISIVPIIFGSILVGLGAYLYNIIENYPPQSLAPYNISILAGGIWIVVGLILAIVSGISKKEFLHTLCVALGTFGMIAGIALTGFGYRLYLITEQLSVEHYYATYNVSASIGICSIAIFLIILVYGFVCKK